LAAPGRALKNDEMSAGKREKRARRECVAGGEYPVKAYSGQNFVGADPDCAAKVSFR
jgi:hypothetical protein